MKRILLMADGADGNGDTVPEKKSKKIKTVKVRNVIGQHINVDGILLPPAETSKGKVTKAAPVVEIPEEHRARLGDLVEDAE